MPYWIEVLYLFMSVIISLSSIVFLPPCLANVATSSLICSKNQSVASTTAPRLSLLIVFLLLPGCRTRTEMRFLIRAEGKDGYEIP